MVKRDGGGCGGRERKKKQKKAFIAYSAGLVADFPGLFFLIENGGREAVKNAQRRQNVAAGAN